MYRGYHPCATTAASLRAGRSAGPDEGGGEDAAPTKARCCGVSGTLNLASVFKYVLHVFFVVLTGLMLFALFAAAGDAVRTQCPMLWEFFLVRVAAGVTVLAFVTLVSQCAPHLFHPHRHASHAVHFCEDPALSDEGDESAVAPYVRAQTLTAVGIAFVYLCLFAILETLILINIVANRQACVDTLRVPGLGNRPLLADLGWVYTAMDYAGAAYNAYAAIRICLDDY